MIWLTAAIAFFGLCTVAAALLQWHVMDGQLTEMKNGGKDTHDLATAAIQQASASQTQADQAKQQTDKLKTSVEEMQKQSAAMRDSADASVAANRAWIVPVPITSTQLEKIGDQVKLHWLNAGKSPAVNVSATAEYEFRDAPGGKYEFQEGCESLKRKLEQGRWSTKTSLLLAGEPFDLMLSNTPSEWNNSSKGYPSLATHGCIWYTDVLSNRERTTEFYYEANKLPVGIAVYPGWRFHRKPLNFR